MNIKARGKATYKNSFAKSAPKLAKTVAKTTVAQAVVAPAQVAGATVAPAPVGAPKFADTARITLV